MMDRKWRAGRGCFRLLFPVIALVLISSPCWGLTVDKALAVVNGEVVTLTDYVRFVGRTYPADEKENVNEQYLRALIEERLIIQEAKRKGYDATEGEITQALRSFLDLSGIEEKELEGKIASGNMSIADYRTLFRENIISLKCIENEVNTKVIVESDLSSYYVKYHSRFMESPEKVVVMAIVMKSGSASSLTEITDLKIRALKIYSEIINGEPFEKQVYRYADESVKSLGGKLGEFRRGTLIPVLDEKIFSLKEGEVSEPVWTKDGIYILKIVKKTEAVYTPQDKVKDKLFAVAFEEKREEAFNIWMKKLWDESSIIIQQ